MPAACRSGVTAAEMPAGPSQFVAVEGDAREASVAEVARVPRGPGRDDALRATLAGAPQTLCSFALAIGGVTGLLPSSVGRAAWTALGVALVAIASFARGASARAGASTRRDRRWPRIYADAAVATIVLLAAAPWLPGAAALANDRLPFVLCMAAAVLCGAATFAPLRAGLAAPVALALSCALADWRVEAQASSVHGGVVGLCLAVAALAIGGGARRAWRREVVADRDRAAHAKALAMARDAAVRADREKSRFLAIASHDLRQPVHALGLFATTLEQRLRGGAEEALVRNIVRSIDGLDRSFNAMLDISRLDAGSVEPNHQHFPLRDVFRRLDMYFSGLAEQAGLGLRFAAGGKSVTSDPQLLERLLGNLIQNAIKYTERGGIVVVARTTATHLNIEVWDTGVGIGGSDLAHVFEEFYQVGRRERARIQGLGMGLAIVKRLASLLGHRLTIRSQVGRGTMFRLGIPIGGQPEIEDATAAADTLPMPAPEPRTILILDDEEAIREGLAMLLEEWGYTAIAASSFQQVERLARTLAVPPDLILSDLRLGDGPDGLAAIEAVRNACGRAVPAIVITGETSADEARRVGERGHALLLKPVEPRKLLNALRGLVS